MNARRTLTAALAGSFLIAPAGAAQADDFASTLTGTALTLSDAGEQAGTAAHEVSEETGLGKKAAVVTGLVQAGADAVSTRDRSTDS